jgi:sterol desaturase/sphingolipid hydroxylase (fatty acid hydroxylase superfamily)
MSSTLIAAYEPAIRLVFFIAVFILMAIWESLAPLRARTIGRRLRWPNNLGLVILDAAAVRLLLPIAAVGMTLLAEQRGWGLFNWLAWPAWVEILVTIVLLDLAIYVQHVLFHYVPPLWRVHRMHHTDLEFDLTTGVRFHPIEVLLSMMIKVGVVAALGPAAVAVLAFEVLLNATSVFNHGNVHMNAPLERVLRWFVVTPDMHRVHHSIAMRETNSNFGFNLPWWDRLFGTYQAQPASGHENMTIGTESFREPRDLWLDRLLLQPFLGQTGSRRHDR